MSKMEKTPGEIRREKLNARQGRAIRARGRAAERAGRSVNLNDWQAREARARALRMKRLRDRGKTLDEIGQKYGGITRQRVRAILERLQA